jgi:hypothetical protein
LRQNSPAGPSLISKEKIAGRGGRGFMTEIIEFVAVPFDYTKDGIIAGEPVRCANPAAAIQRAQELWKFFGHAGAVALSRTSDFELGVFDKKQILRRFGQAPGEI